MQPYLVGSVLFGADPFIAAMVQSKLRLRRGFGPCTALGVVRRGVLVGGVVFHNYQGFSVEGSFAFDRPDWALPQTIRTLLAYPFLQLRCERLEALIGRRNKAARAFVKGLGFREEGVHRRKHDGREDAVSYAMLRGECRWIKEQKHGQIRTAAAGAP